MKNESIIIEQTINAPTAKVWEAITDNNQMKQWYFELADFKPEVDFEFQFLAGPDEKKYLHRCKVTKLLMRKRLPIAGATKGMKAYLM